LLVDWTRGKNIILSSAAPSVTELRGPYDVANLACLLGFSMERAKASVSETCRSLLENALRKKKFYKEAIRVELISPTEQINGFDDWLKWDPISSGEGDLHLDDMEKSFAASSKESTTVKAIDFVSIMNELPSHGLHIKDIVYGDNNGSNLDLLTATKGDKPTDVYNTPIDFKLHDPPKTTETLLSENENLEALISVEGREPCAMIIEEETKIPNELKVCLSSPEAEKQNMRAEVHEAVHEESLSGEKGSANICNDVPTAGISASFGNKPSTNDSICPPVAASNEVGIEQNKGKMVSSFFDSFLREEENVKDAGDVVVTPVNSPLPFSGGSLNEDIQKEHLTVKDEDISVALSSTSVPLRSHDELQNIGASTGVHEPSEVTSMEVQVELKDDSHIDHSYAQQSSSGRVGRKQGSSRRSVSLPFNRLLKHSQFKKSRKPKTKSTILSLSELIE
nr:polymerase/histidinol phosphatase-like protein [Tanacetum cinerariifolium]